MLIKSNNRTEAIRAVINEWLKDNTLYCDSCGKDYFSQRMPCCSSPYILNNFTAMKMIMDECREKKETNLKATAATKSNAMRFSVKMPERLLCTLDNYFKTYGEKGLFRDKRDLHSFMRNFHQLSTAERV